MHKPSVAIQDSGLSKFTWHLHGSSGFPKNHSPNMIQKSHQNVVKALQMASDLIAMASNLIAQKIPKECGQREPKKKSENGPFCRFARYARFARTASPVRNCRTNHVAHGRPADRHQRGDFAQALGHSLGLGDEKPMQRDGLFRCKKRRRCFPLKEAFVPSSFLLLVASRSP